MNRTAFQWLVAMTPFATACLVELQRQLDAREIDAWSMGSVATGALASLFVALLNWARAEQEDADGTVGSGR